MYSFSSSNISGTWCNSDNSDYFSNYSQTNLTLHANDNPSDFNTDIFLVFKNVNSMVHVYKTTTTDFIYNFAPKGLECTMVAVGVKNNKLYSSFIPITIGSNQTVNFSLSVTTTDDFKKALKALD